MWTAYESFWKKMLIVVNKRWTREDKQNFEGHRVSLTFSWVCFLFSLLFFKREFGFMHEQQKSLIPSATTTWGTFPKRGRRGRDIYDSCGFRCDEGICTRRSNVNQRLSDVVEIYNFTNRRSIAMGKVMLWENWNLEWFYGSLTVFWQNSDNLTIVYDSSISASTATSPSPSWPSPRRNRSIFRAQNVHCPTYNVRRQLWGR